jgi:hypothetical protein
MRGAFIQERGNRWAQEVLGDIKKKFYVLQFLWWAEKRVQNLECIYQNIYNLLAQSFT